MLRAAVVAAAAAAGPATAVVPKQQRCPAGCNNVPEQCIAAGCEPQGCHGRGTMCVPKTTATAQTCAQIGTDLSCPSSKPFSGNPYDTGDMAGCCAKCGEKSGCAAWTWHASKCYLKASCDKTKKESGATSGRAPAGPVPTPAPVAPPPVPPPAPPTTPPTPAPPVPPPAPPGGPGKVYPANGQWQIQWDVAWEYLDHSEAKHSGDCSDKSQCDGKVKPVGDGRERALMPPVSKNHHAAFVHELPNNNGIGMVWFAGPKTEQCFNCSVYYSRLPVDSTQWQMPKLISRRYDWGAENPNLFTDPATGYLYAHHASSPPSDCKGDPTGLGKGCCKGGSNNGGCQGFSNIWRVVSKDGRGDTWEMPERFFSVNSSITRNRPIQLSTGKWLFPMFHAVGSFSGSGGCDWPGKSEDIDHSGILHSLSSDAGALEWPEAPVAGSGCRVHPSIVDLGGGHLKTFFRSRDKTWIYVMDSYDNGETWTLPKKTKIPNNNASLQANKLHTSKYAVGGVVPVVLIFDNTHGSTKSGGGVDVGGRYPLSVALSYDGGASFPYVRDLETAHREFSYPSVLQAQDGRIHASNTHARNTVEHNIVTEDWIRAGVNGSGTVGLFKGGPI